MSNFGEQLNLVVDKLSDKLGVAANAIMPMMIRQAFATFISTIIALCVFSVMLFISFKQMIKHKNVIFKDNDITATFESLWFVSSVFSIIGFIVSLIIFLSVGLTAAINPEYWAFQKIMEMIK